MNAIHIISKTDETVTLSRDDYDRLMEAVEDAEDIATIDAALAREKELGAEVAYANYLPVEAVERLLEGEHPVRIWREHRGLTQLDLAAKAEISRTYLNEIESGKKPGSVAAYAALAKALGVAVDDLLP